MALRSSDLVGRVARGVGNRVLSVADSIASVLDRIARGIQRVVRSNRGVLGRRVGVIRRIVLDGRLVGGVVVGVVLVARGEAECEDRNGQSFPLPSKAPGPRGHRRQPRPD